MQATVRMTRSGQVSIPIEIREALDLKPGDLIIIDVIGDARKVQSQMVGEQGNAEALPVLT